MNTITYICCIISITNFKTELIDILSNGTYNGCYCGMNEEEFLKLNISKTKQKAIDFFSYFYNNVEFQFYDNVLDCIIISFFRINVLDQGIFINGEQIDDISLEKILNLLHKNKLKWQFDQKACFDQQLAIKIEEGPVLVFEYNENLYLNRLVMGRKYD